MESSKEMDNELENIEISSAEMEAEEHIEISSAEMEAEDYYNMPLPKGYRFLPSDSEIITFYLLKKILCEPLPAPFESRVIDENQLYSEPPHRVAEINLFDEEAKEWYFFSRQNNKLHNGTRWCRIVGTNKGYWEPNGIEKSILDEEDGNGNGNVIGFKISMDYYSGKPRFGHKTPWIMDEYRLCQQHHKEDIRSKDLWIMGRIKWSLKEKDGDDLDSDDFFESE